ncbi:MAG: hypothetical protein NT116_04060 [Candidatus Parcubacteria bacterium]|nr:hypothetical protein [Candidatus Parcubacteria bacterium]
MKHFLRDSLGWGVALWLIGYILGFVFYAFVPANIIGWYIMPFGTVITLFVTFKFIKSNALQYYLKVACVWTLLAIILDYLFLVKLLNPAGGYYKLDVYVYYGLTFVLPLLVGWYKTSASGGKSVAK